MSDDTPKRPDASSSDQPPNEHSTRRREYLKLTGAAAVSVAGSSFATGLVTAKEAGGIEFARTVDMVEDAGADPTGEESCHEEIMEHADDDTLLEFPAGTYLLDKPVTLKGYERLGLRGAAEDVVFEFTSGTDGYVDILVDDVGRFAYEDIDWDITAENCAPGFGVRARERLHVENLEVHGRQDNSGGFTLRPGIENSDGLGIIKNFVAKDGCTIGSVERNGVLVSEGRNYGTLRFVDCHLEEFSNNGIYAAASAGPIQVQGGVFRNCEPSQLRFSGEGSYVEDALVELDISKIPPEGEPEGLVNGRGIWWETKNTDPLRTGGEIRDTEIIMRSEGRQTVPNTSGAILVPSNGGACTIKDTRIQMDITPRVAVHAKAPVGNPDSNKPPAPEPHRIVMRDVEITGSANDWAAVQIEERPNSVIEDCHLDIGYRDGIVLAECDGSTVRDTTINSKYGGGRPLVLWGTDAEIEDVTSNNADPIPDGTDGD